MDIEVRPIEEGSIEDYLRADFRAFGEAVRPDEMEVIRKVFEVDRSLAALDGSLIVGTTSTASFQLTVPGAEIPMAAVTGVGVSPTHRRRGILTEMMRRQLEHTRDRGEAIAGLWASESLIYGRFGYGMAAWAADFEIERQRSQFLRPSEDPGRVRMIDKAEALEVVPGVFDRFRAGQPGAWSRNRAWWEVTWADLEHWRDGASALWFVLHETGSDPDGFAVYRVKHDWEGAFPGGTLKLRDLVGLNEAAYRALWSYCFGVDLMTKISAWPRGIDEPLVHMLADPRRLQIKINDGMWLRLVDVPAALTGRRYPTEGRVVFDIHDTFCPWVEGRYSLEAGPRGGECRATDAEPDLRLGAAELGAAYLGGVRFSTLARAGRVVEERPGALATADALFRWDPQPWCPAVF